LAEQAAMSGCVGVSVPAAKIRIHRGRAKLRAALEEGCEFATDDRGITVCDPVSALRASRQPSS
jgi:hypothetical protein